MSTQQPVASIVCSVMAPLAVFALGTTPQIATPDSSVPTAIEQALIERSCRAAETSLKIGAHRECLDAQLLSLRTDFGRDLSRLSTASRRKIDAACNRLRVSEQREAYLECLGDQLVALRSRQSHGTSAVSDDGAVAPAELPAPRVAAEASVRQASSWRRVMVVFGGVGSVLAAAGVAFVVVRARSRNRPCRVCGVNVLDSDLCPTCRHEAAEALRRAAVERAQSQKAQEEEERAQREHEAEQHELTMREEENVQPHDEEVAHLAHANEQFVQGSGTAVPVAAAVEPVGPGGEENAAFDPYAVLGVPPEASLDAIRAAYQNAKTKYDPDLVSFLGDEAQAHFKSRVESVERAYQMLSAVR